jgi:hypothetical protein
MGVCILYSLRFTYTCAQCRFFLHKSCVKLPRKKRHTLHSHLLTLLAKPPYANCGCNVCGRDDCDGFTYHCEKCEFDAHVQCSLISDIFTHDGHDHPLILSRAPYHEKCSCCDRKGNVFKCADCEFTLDVRCATLPRIVRYQSFEQPFKLCYNIEYEKKNEIQSTGSTTVLISISLLIPIAFLEESRIGNNWDLPPSCNR